jgi:hypothetical protein
VTAITRCGAAANWLSQWDFEGLFCARAGEKGALLRYARPSISGHFPGFPRKMFCYFGLAPSLHLISKIIASLDSQYSSNNCLRAIDLAAAGI